MFSGFFFISNKVNMSYSETRLICFLSIITDYGIGRECIVITSHAQCKFYQIISFGVENREKGKNVCYLIPSLNSNIHFQLSNEGKAY